MLTCATIPVLISAMHLVWASTLALVVTLAMTSGVGSDMTPLIDLRHDPKAYHDCDPSGDLSHDPTGQIRYFCGTRYLGRFELIIQKHRK